MLKLCLFLIFSGFIFASDIPFLKISFLDIGQDVEEARKEGKFLFIMFYQEGCPFCDKMRRVTFQDKEVKEYFTKHFYMIEINIKGSLPVIDVDGREYTEKTFSRKYGVRATPVFLFYDKDGEVILKLPGYYKPGEFLLIGKYIVEGHYKNENIFSFIRKYRRSR